MIARHHHYLSQCYLRGFTKGGGKKSKLTVIDFRENKHFETNTRNVGGIRDFNRIDVDGIDQNAVEKALAKFEGEAANALRELDATLEFVGETRIIVLNLIALLAIRSPEMREHWRKFHENISEKIMDLALATKARWESQMRRMKESGEKVNEDISYDDIKEFHESKRYEIVVPRERHIHMEFNGIDTILPYLVQRNWLLMKATNESGPFITTNNPINLTWKEPDKIPPFYRNSPGYGMKNTEVYFPVSKSLAISGEFDGPNATIEANRELVSVLNTRMLMFAYNQIYSPKIGFYFRGEDHEIFEGTQVLKKVRA